MKAMIIIQRVLATLVSMYGLVVMFSEAELTASLLSQIQPFLLGLALIVVSAGWLILTGLEEDWFISKNKRSRKE